MTLAPIFETYRLVLNGNNMAINEIERPTSAFAVIDDAGANGEVHKLRPDQDDAFGLVAGIVFPGDDLDHWSDQFKPAFDIFRSAAPAGAKLHITDAFADPESPWATTARTARREVHALIESHELPIVYTARRLRIARQNHEMKKHLSANISSLADQKPSTPTHYVHKKRSRKRVVDECYQGVVSLLDIFARHAQLQMIKVYPDQIDDVVRRGMDASANRLRHLSKRTQLVTGFNIVTRSVETLGQITASLDLPQVDVAYVEMLNEPLGKEHPLVFAADVVANGINHFLRNKAPDANLNSCEDIAGWQLAHRVFAPPTQNSIYDRT